MSAKKTSNILPLESYVHQSLSAYSTIQLKPSANNRNLALVPPFGNSEYLTPESPLNRKKYRCLWVSPHFKLPIWIVRPVESRRLLFWLFSLQWFASSTKFLWPPVPLSLTRLPSSHVPLKTRTNYVLLLSLFFFPIFLHKTFFFLIEYIQ